MLNMLFRSTSQSNRQQIANVCLQRLHCYWFSFESYCFFFFISSYFVCFVAMNEIRLTFAYDADHWITYFLFHCKVAHSFKYCSMVMSIEIRLKWINKFAVYQIFRHDRVEFPSKGILIIHFFSKSKSFFEYSDLKRLRWSNSPQKFKVMLLFSIH